MFSYVGAAEVEKQHICLPTLPCYRCDNVVFAEDTQACFHDHEATMVMWLWWCRLAMGSPWCFQPRQRTPPQGCPRQRWRRCRDTLRPWPMSPSPLLPAAEGCHAGGGGGGVGAYFTVGSLANFHSPSITLTNPSGRRLSSGFCRSVTFGFRSESISLPAPPSKSQQASGQPHLQLYIFFSKHFTETQLWPNWIHEISLICNFTYVFLPNISRKLNWDQTSTKLNPWNWREKQEIGRNIQIEKESDRDELKRVITIAITIQKKLIIEDTVAITIQKNYPEPLSPFLYLEPSLPRKNILKTGISLPSLSSSRSCFACDCGLLSIVITPCICICICMPATLTVAF